MVATDTPMPHSVVDAEASENRSDESHEALHSFDGWGGQHVNQVTNWNVPKEPPILHNGTDLWLYLLTGGKPTVEETKLDYKPVSNFGGTWGADDDKISKIWSVKPNDSKSMSLSVAREKVDSAGGASGVSSTGDGFEWIPRAGSGRVKTNNNCDTGRDQYADYYANANTTSINQIRTSDIWGLNCGNIWEPQSTRHGDRSQKLNNITRNAPLGNQNPCGNIFRGIEDGVPDDCNNNGRAVMGGCVEGTMVGLSSSNDKSKPLVLTKNNEKGICGGGKQATDVYGRSQKQKPEQKTERNAFTLTADMVKQSQEYRFLIDAGYRKKDVRRALLTTQLNIEEAAELLRKNAVANEKPSTECVDQLKPQSSVRYFSEGSQPIKPLQYNNNSVRNMAGGNNAGERFFPQQQPIQPPMQGQIYFNQGRQNVRTAVNTTEFAYSHRRTIATTVDNATSHILGQPYLSQLEVVVQIELAIQHGFLSREVLDQRLSKETILLIRELLYTTKHLYDTQASLAYSNNSNNFLIHVAIGQYKQKIALLQNQIKEKQNICLKEQQLQLQQQEQQNCQQYYYSQSLNIQHPAGSLHAQNFGYDYTRETYDVVTTLQGMHLSRPDENQELSQQSKLHQWMKPNFD